MRSSRRTTGQVAENSVVDDATDACSLHRIFATFLANSSTSLGRPYFYLIKSNGWKSLCLLTGLSVQDYSKLLLQSKLVLVRNNNDGSRSIRVDMDTAARTPPIDPRSRRASSRPIRPSRRGRGWDTRHWLSGHYLTLLFLHKTIDDGENYERGFEGGFVTKNDTRKLMRRVSGEGGDNIVA